MAALEESEETPEMEARSHSPAFLKKAARLTKKGGKKSAGKRGKKSKKSKRGKSKRDM